MENIETHHREKVFVLWGHCQNLLDDAHSEYFEECCKWNLYDIFFSMITLMLAVLCSNDLRPKFVYIALTLSNDE